MKYVRAVFFPAYLLVIALLLGPQMIEGWIAGWAHIPHAMRMEIFQVAVVVYLLVVILRRVIRVRTQRHVPDSIIRMGPASVVRMSPDESIPPALAEAWRKVRAAYGDSNFATWVIARIQADQSDEQILDFAKQWRSAYYGPDIDILKVARHESGHAVVAHALGCTATKVTCRPGRGLAGRAEYSTPAPRPTDEEFGWLLLVSVLAGQAVDRLDGHSDGGSGSDIEKALRWCAVIISTGKRPVGYQGPLTTDELMANASDLATRILEQNAEHIDTLAERLAEAGTLGNHDIRDVLDQVVVPPVSFRSPSARKP